MTVQTENLSGIDIRAEIDRLRKDRNAVILAHYYQRPEIQDLADFIGDSLELSKKAAATDAEVIAFCGVKFMAETAKILAPKRPWSCPIWMPGAAWKIRCPPEKFRPFREAHPDHIALTYINCSTEVKALSRHHRHQLQRRDDPGPDPQGPEDHLRPRPASGRLPAASSTARCCCGRASASSTKRSRETELLKLKAQHPGAPVAAHPECPPHIIDHADYVGSTSGILNFAKTFPGQTADRGDRTAHHPPDGTGAARTRCSSAPRAPTATATATSAPTWR